VAFSNSSSELPESQIEYHDNSGARRWVVLLIYVVLALVVATLVVFAGRWVYHKVSNNSSPAPTTLSPQKTSQGTQTSPTPSSNTPSPAPNSTKPGTPAQNQSGNSSSGTSSVAGNKTPGNTAKPAPQPTTLPNNGPGQAIALFVVTTFVAATLHFTAALRRAAKSV
jgi:cytoskeletal protein RodZ